MATFTVDPATLQQLSGTLSDVHGQMQAMPPTREERIRPPKIQMQHPST